MTHSTDKKQHTQNTKMMGLNAHTGLRAGEGFFKYPSFSAIPSNETEISGESCPVSLNTSLLPSTWA